MISDLVVWAAVALTVAFIAGWAVSPALRSWIERPKHTFLDAVRRYDRDARAGVPREQRKS
jgi:hypothetical protein